MNFDVAAESYDAFMGRYSQLLSPLMADYAGVAEGDAKRVLDVGCGPGALTAELVARVGADYVAAVDPAEQFVLANLTRNPGVDVRVASAEALPFADGTFDATLAQLVVHFMSDPVAGITEMARVTRPGGVVAACVWDYAGDSAPLSVFWRAAHELDTNIVDESHLAGAREGHLAELFRAAGLREVEQGALSGSRTHSTFDEWWQPYTRSVGPAGVYLTGLDPASRDQLREKCLSMLGEGPIELSFSAWVARGLA